MSSLYRTVEQTRIWTAVTTVQQASVSARRLLAPPPESVAVAPVPPGRHGQRTTAKTSATAASLGSCGYRRRMGGTVLPWRATEQEGSARAR